MNVNEAVEHLLDSQKLKNQRCQEDIDKIGKKDDLMGNFFFEVRNIEEKKEIILNMWKKKKSIIQKLTKIKKRYRKNEAADTKAIASKSTELN